MSEKLFKQLADLIPVIDGWCSVERAQDLAMAVLLLRPQVSICVGVWGGRDTFALALAHQAIGSGRVIAIDPWSAPASVDGQGAADAEWWGSQERHDLVYRRFMDNRRMLGLEGVIDVRRQSSNDVEPVECGVFISDGNHGPQAISDVERFAPGVQAGGIAYLDDLNWSGGAVLESVERLKAMGFVELFKRDTGAFFQRR
jgi:hypothetical protein